MTGHKTKDGRVRVEKKVPEKEIGEAHENGGSENKEKHASFSRPNRNG
jgi:hypothetical protein